MTQYKFPCGCSFPIVGESPNKSDIPALDLDIEKISLNCQPTWDEIGKGNTKGMFQLESNLCQHWCKEIKPQNIMELAAVISLVRPGCLKAMSEGKSMTQHYADRKAGKEEVPAFNPVVDAILAGTFNIIVFQEQSMKITEGVAGFNLQEADMLRKAIGKKIAEEMAKVKKLFLEKAIQLKVLTEEQAKEIFEQIEKSQRYSFNASHAVAYAILGYWSAFVKYHFPLAFYTSWLRMSKDTQDPAEERRVLINDAKLNDISVLSPDFRSLEPNFYTDGEVIKFGLNDIKGVGASALEKVLFVAKNEVEPKIGKLENWSWYQFLTEFSRRISSTTVKALISGGALAYMKVPRSRMHFEYTRWMELTENEQNWIVAGNFNNLLDALKAVQPAKKEGGGAATKNRTAKIGDLIKSLENPPHSLEDKPDQIAYEEEQLLGISLTFSQIDACDTREANITCREYLDGNREGYLIFAVSIERVNQITTKTGKNPGQKMAFLTVKDSTCSLDNCVIFPDAYAEFGNEIVPGNTVLIQGERDKKKGSLIVQKAWSI